MKINKHRVVCVFSLLFLLLIINSCSSTSKKGTENSIFFENQKNSSKAKFNFTEYAHLQNFKRLENIRIEKIDYYFDKRMVLYDGKSIYLFDGTENEKLKIPFPIDYFKMSLMHDTIWLAGLNNCGYYFKDMYGKSTYIELSKEKSGIEYKKISETKEQVFFIAKTKIKSWNKNTLKPDSILSLPLGYENRYSFVLNNKIYLTIYPKGLVTLNSGVIQDIDFKYNVQQNKDSLVDELPKFPKVTSSVKLNDSLIVFTDYLNLYSFNGLVLKKLNLNTKREITIQTLERLNAHSFFVGTLSQGLILYSLKSPQKLMQYNVDKGLKQNEINSLFLDKQKNLWLAEPKAVQKINFSLALQDFSHSKIKGNLKFFSKEKNLLGTSQGLFQLVSNPKFKITNLGLLNESILGIEKYKSQNLFITQSGIYKKIDSSDFTKKLKFSLIDDYIYLKKYHKIYLAGRLGAYVVDLKNYTINKLPQLKDIHLKKLVNQDSNIWFTTKKEVYKITIDSVGLPNKYFKYKFPENKKELVSVVVLKHKIYFITENEIYTHNSKKNIIQLDTSFIEFTKFYTNKSSLWLKDHEDRWINTNTKDTLPIFSKLMDKINFIQKVHSTYIIGNSNQYFLLQPKSLKEPQLCFINKLLDINNKEIPLNQLKLNGFSSGFKIKLNAPFYYKTGGVEYRYKILGITKKWSAWQSNNTISIPYLPFGKHDILYQAKNIFNQHSYPKIFSVQVKKPIWMKMGFIIAVLLLLISITAYIVYLLMKGRDKQLVLEKKQLQQKIKEHTEELEHKQMEIIDSINYASRIQTALQPNINELNKIPVDFFILNRPKNIVSGDFYWFYHQYNSLYITVGDCTGHGVPGAFMSVLGLTLLNQIIKYSDISKPNIILDNLKELIISSLNQKNQQFQMQDGIDMALLKIDLLKREIHFSGAYNPVYIIRQGELFEFKGNRMPIGLFIRKNKFSSQQFQLQKGDTMYLFSDGYADQIGGEKGYKFTKKRLKGLLCEIGSKPLAQQKLILETSMEDWQRDYEQVDDILMLGIKI